MHHWRVARTAALAVTATLVLGGAQECGSSSGRGGRSGGGSGLPCTVTDVTPPRVDPNTGWIVASMATRCDRPLSSIRVFLSLEKHESGKWRNIKPDVSTRVPYPRERTYAVSNPHCTPGRWRLYVRITATRNGKPVSGLEKVTRSTRIAC